jgi:hypothetical protein
LSQPLLLTRPLRLRLLSHMLPLLIIVINYVLNVV